MKIINTIKNHIMKVATRKNKELPFVHSTIAEDLARLQSRKAELIAEGADIEDIQVIEEALMGHINK